MSTLKLQILLGAVDKLTAPLKAVTGQSRITAKDLADAKTKVRELEKQSAKIDGFKQLGAQLGVTNSQLQVSKNKFEEIKKTIASTANPTRMMVNEYNKAEKAVKELTAKQAEMNSKYEGMKLSLQSATMGTKDLTKTQERLKNATAAANEKLKQQRADLDRISEQQKRMNQIKANYRQTQDFRGQIAGHGAAALASGTAMGMTTLKPVIEFAKAETAVVDLKVTMMGKGGVVNKEFQAISDLATQLGNKLPGTTADFQNMMNTLSKQGMTAKAILGGLGEATAYLGVQLKLPYDQAAQSASKLQDATRTTEKDMMGLMDVIQRAHYLGMDIGNQEAAYASLSPVLNLLKKDGLEAAKALSPLLVMADQASMGGEKAGNAYRKAFQRSMNAKNMAKANDLLKADGIKLDFTDGKGNFGGLDKMFAQLGKLKNLSEQKRLAVFNQVWGDDSETQQVLTLMMTKGLAGYNETIAKMEAQASLQERVNAQLGTMGNLWDAATGTFTNAMVNFGESIAPEVKSVIEWIGELSERLGNWAKKNPELSNTLMRIAAFTSIAAIAFGGLSLAVAAILGPMAIMKLTFGVLGVKGSLFGNMLKLLLSPIKMLIGFVRLLTGAFIRMGIALLTNPITWIIGLVVALAYAAYLVYQNWDKIGPWFKELWEGCKRTLGEFWDYLKELPEKALKMGKDIVSNIMDGITEKWKDLMAQVKSLTKYLPDWFTGGGVTIEQEGASGPGYLSGNRGGGLALAGASGYGPRIVEPARIKPANKQIIDNSVNSPINVYQQPGQSPQDVAKTVRDEVMKMQREERAKGRASLRDNS
ncbi:phage tail tape measure protein [Aeromonas veronii]|uniref:phage tail tape measure protein n=1 Tax=Aeromonas veronii TaxID=654 RepID=UPI0039826FF3